MAAESRQPAQETEAAEVPAAARAAAGAGPSECAQTLAAAMGNRAFSRLACAQRPPPIRPRRGAVAERTDAAPSAPELALARSADRRRLQRARTNVATLAMPAGTLLEAAERSPAVQDELRGGLDAGEPLDGATAARAESLLGGEVPDVRIHRSESARNTVDQLDGAALTLGEDILLGHGAERRPAAKEWLLAHELAHAVQQGMAPARQGSVARASVEASERDADAFADAFTDGREPVPTLEPTGRPLAAKVIWKYIHDIPPDKLLIIDVDDGDFVGGCVRQVVPHLGIKLIQKSPHTQLFNVHIGYMTNAAGERCMFFYESVTGICETKCFPTQEELEEAWDEVLEWLKDLLVKVLTALAIVALVALAAILAWMIVQAIAAALAAFAALLALA